MNVNRCLIKQFVVLEPETKGCVIFELPGLEDPHNPNSEAEGWVLDPNMFEKIKVGEYAEFIAIPDYVDYIKKTEKKVKRKVPFDERFPEYNKKFIGTHLFQGEITSILYIPKQIGNINTKYYIEIDCDNFYVLIKISEKDIDKYNIGDYVYFVTLLDFAIEDPNIPYKRIK